MKPKEQTCKEYDEMGDNLFDGDVQNDMDAVMFNQIYCIFNEKNMVKRISVYSSRMVFICATIGVDYGNRHYRGEKIGIVSKEREGTIGCELIIFNWENNINSHE